ncbi:MAG: peptidyl-alpha-hydroxyglycine alpha-amidating lyase family protein [Chloroflexi bacterium]|nr:peptidyl-alpha-hydroxyglycine alpha-amidating lyase family protein [Chloroflexota bacterium]
MTVRYQAGPNLYELDPDWPKLPEGHELKQVAGVAVDAEDRVYLYNRGNHKLSTFDRNGNYQSSWEQAAKTPHGIHIASNAASKKDAGTSSEQHVFLADTGAHVVTKHTAEGNILLTLGTPGKPSDTGQIKDFLVEKPGQPFNLPTGVATAPNGDIFVSDGYGNCRVHKFDKNGVLQASWGIPGKSAPLEFHLPHGLAIDPQGRLLVCDMENHRIQVLDQDGNFLAMWNGFKQPCSLAIDADGLVFVAELGHRVSVVDLDGRIVAQWGGESSREPGRFVAPHTAAVDSHGDVYIGEVLEGQRVQKFVRK